MSTARMLVVAALAAATTSLATAGPSAASGGCTDGVIVVVDATAVGGDISQRCVEGSPGSGLDALLAAGHEIGYVPGIGGMVCTIDGRPDPCNHAPAHAYWSYWHADQGGSWQYSTTGAGSRHPAPGTVEGWRFGDGTAAPGIAPPDGEPATEPDPEEDPAEDPPVDAPDQPRSSDPDDDPAEPEEGASRAAPTEAAPDGSAETPTDTAAEVPLDTPVDGTAGYRAPDASAEAPASDEETHDGTGHLDEATIDELAAAAPDDDAAPTGLLAAGGLLAGLAAMTALRVRRRRLEA